MILAGDIGGTNTRLALFDEELNKQAEQVYRNEGCPGLTEHVRAFFDAVAGEEKIDRAAFGVAGPVKAGRASMTNLPWRLDERELARDLKLAKVALINDLVAHAEGIELLKPEQLIVIHRGEVEREGNRAVIAAGTGLGEAGIVWDESDRRYRAFASEGGHCDFAPRDDRQVALMKWLRGKYPNASWERVLSGPGLRNIYDFLISSGQLGPAALREQSTCAVCIVLIEITVISSDPFSALDARHGRRPVTHAPATTSATNNEQRTTSATNNAQTNKRTTDNTQRSGGIGEVPRAGDLD